MTFCTCLKLKDIDILKSSDKFGSTSCDNQPGKNNKMPSSGL